MAFDPAWVRGEENPLAQAYTRFRVTERVLLTGHSHQAWPDCAFEAQQRAWLDAAELVDAKWPAAFEQARAVRAGFARLLGELDPGQLVLGASTHDLLVRLLSALPLEARPRVVTTDGEFHAMRRQLDRLGESLLEVERVPVEPVDTLAARLAAAVDDRTAAVMVSAVMFRDARIVPGLALVAEAAERHGAIALVDVYHALGALPFDLRAQGLEGAYVTGGGYKYCELGEGNCFLRVPPDCRLRPVVTGWFAEFERLEAGARGESVTYPAGAARFQGSTYDPVSHYRGAAVFAFFAHEAMTDVALREAYQAQLGLLAAHFDALDLDPALIARPDVPLASLGGFLALRCPRAAEVQAALAARGVATDQRDGMLRLGPAPYLSGRQLEDGIAALAETVAGLEGRAPG